MPVRVPVVPEYITVHLGAPNEAARNITIPFIEYITNVATSEIYPSFPTDAIKANILAQISFALNRVYNEWYPSQGYGFDITSDPTYDQTFREDSQFFENIAVIVDDLFNDYIRREGQIQPLFAQYCAGKNGSTCNGLSQWGSVNLANRGFDPLEILRYYYGDDIQVVYDAPVEPLMSSYPGFPLAVGSAGDPVRALKIQLNRIANNYPAIPVISNLNEFFTVEMERAVKVFQDIFSLEQTGEVDKSTWYKIKYIYNSVKRIADLESEGISEEEATLLYEQVLEYGDQGPYIRLLAYLLSVISYLDSSLPMLEVGDVFDDNLQEMLIAFQEKYGLDADGKLDVKDWRVLLDVYNQLLESVPSKYYDYRDEFYPGYFLSIGMTGDDVKRLQQFLYQICVRKKNIPGVRVDGTFDSLTESSVKAIQKMAKLPENGVVGPATWYQIVEMSKS